VSEEPCRLCATADAVAPEDVLLRTEHFTAATGMQVPGWVLLWSHRHDAQGLWQLTDEESAELGPLLRDLALAVKDACGAERTYVLSLGEHALHFHAMVMARTADTPVGARGPALLAAAGGLADGPASREVARRVRAALAARRPTPMPTG
jgi:diadenosine tetraphosphate (Ap4A) HIT family hydrolase